MWPGLGRDWYSLRMLACHLTMLFVRTALCVRCLRRRPADVYGPRAHATVGHVHSSPGRSCWFLVGQVARGRQIAGQVAVLFSRGAHVVTQGDMCGDPTATHWFYGLIAVFYQKQVLRR